MVGDWITAWTDSFDQIPFAEFFGRLRLADVWAGVAGGDEHPALWFLFAGRAGDCALANHTAGPGAAGAGRGDYDRGVFVEFRNTGGSYWNPGGGQHRF